VTNLQLWLSVIEVGCFFSLLGLAYLVVMEASGFFNLTIGPYAMLGGLVWTALVINEEMDKWLALAISLVSVLVISALTELLIVRPIERRSGGSEFPALVAVAALVFGLSQGAGLLFDRLPLPGQPLLTFTPWEIGDAFAPPSLVVALVVAVIAFGGVAALARWTSFGRGLRAVGDNKGAAQILGLRVNRIRLTAFVVSGLIAWAAGVAFSAKGGVSYDVGLHWALLGFLAIVIGGTGSWFAPLIGGMILGLTEVMVPYYVGGEYTDYVILLFALVFFGLRPQGVYVRKVRV
jgi:branched-chain amino acid transport system permease protein